MSLNDELKRLFGQEATERAAALAPTKINALAVQDAAGALSLLEGHPDKQIAYVRSMHPDTAAALCRWIGDPTVWVAVAGITRH